MYVMYKLLLLFYQVLQILPPKYGCFFFKFCNYFFPRMSLTFGTTKNMSEGGMFFATLSQTFLRN